VKLRPVEPGDVAAWTALRAALWPDADAAELARECGDHFTGRKVGAVVFVCADDNGRLIGMIEADLRSVAEGCLTSPVPFIEGWYVAPDARGSGIGRTLMAKVEDWARTQGFTELGSDALIDNTHSHAAHAALGFEEVERIVCFRKALQV
jgi:aminoglycoside 6'-N-acetyltransferase I